MLQKTIKIWDVNVDNIAISKLVKTKNNSKYLIGYLDKAIRSLVLIMPKTSRYLKTFNFKNGDKDKNNNLISFRIDDEKLLEKYKAIWTMIENFKNIEFNASPVYGDKYIKTKTRTYSEKVYANLCALNMPEDDVEYESFVVIPIGPLPVYQNNYYLQGYLDSLT